MNQFFLALLGDGPFARWGNCPQLRAELTRLYSQSDFQIENFAHEGARVGFCMTRVSSDFEGKKSLSYVNPGVVIMDCCAHSQYLDGPEGLSEYRDLLRRVWEEIERTTSAKILFHLPAPPPRDRFLEGHPLFQNTSKATRGRMADGLKMFVDEARSIAEDEGWPVADSASEVEKRLQSGDLARRFFDQSDGVHPSNYGYTLMAKVLVREMDSHRFVEEKIQK